MKIYTLHQVLCASMRLIAATLLISAFSINASAQQDVGDIIDQIFKSGKLPDVGQQFPDRKIPGQTQGGLIDNIPVEVRFNLGGKTLPQDAILVATAYAPAPINVRQSKPRVLGQTQIMLADLMSPVQIIIAAPSTVTKDLEYARIEAKIIDSNGGEIYVLPTPGRFDGYDAPVLNLRHISDTATLPSTPTPTPAPA